LFRRRSDRHRVRWIRSKSHRAHDANGTDVHDFGSYVDISWRASGRRGCDGVRVSARQRATHTVSDAQGHYSFSSPSAGRVWLGFGTPGYTGGLKTNVSLENSTWNFILDRSFVVTSFFANPDSFYLNPAGDAVAGTISGDEFLPGDDASFGGLCDHTACRLVDLSNGSVARIEVRLRWKNAMNQLALYVSQQPYWEGVPPSTPLVPPERYCCSSELVANVRVDSYAGAWVAIAFERAGAGPTTKRYRVVRANGRTGTVMRVLDAPCRGRALPAPDRAATASSNARRGLRDEGRESCGECAGQSRPSARNKSGCFGSPRCLCRRRSDL
jgi:hypothetical protein